MADYAPELKNVLRDAGWRFERSGKGDHESWLNPSTDKHVSVDAKIKSRHTANGILKQAGLHNSYQRL